MPKGISQKIYAERSCSECGSSFVPKRSTSFCCSPDCQKERTARLHYQNQVERVKADPEKRRGQVRAYKAKRIEHYRAKRRKWYHDHKEQEAAAYKLYTERLGKKRTLDYYRRNRAIADGREKAWDSFVLVRTKPQDNLSHWRPLAPGVIFLKEEEAIAVFNRYKDTWTVSALFTATNEAREIVRRLQERELVTEYYQGRNGVLLYRRMKKRGKSWKASKA